ncbi:ACP S-malonyltransferase [Cognatishimia sp. F0-27]|uniref:ACP S-malonyltransferase n=1 Tax=Cognatishimia sp. F0-27 TaxID=2816855 RepID=UPI001D0C9BDA|nr:ACP S-malonyltransferase [Cognatishimia sp. F0-27]MCC1493271.1 ACP S-malonyltransferase [Cognatishimia sp. F0-27]
MNVRPSRYTAPVGDGVAFLFPGQGFQYAQMGRALYDGEPGFRRTMERLDAHLTSGGHQSVLERLYDDALGKDAPFDQTVLTHPAIFMLEIALAERLIAAGVVPQAVLGSSLGECAAAVVAGTIGAEDMLDCVAGAAQAVAKACPPGRMLAVMAGEARVERLCRECSGALTLAGVHGPDNVVVSGSPDAIAELAGQAATSRIAAIALPVTHAFHGPGMDRAAAEIDAIFAAKSFAAPKIPWISCRTGRVVTRVTPGHFAAVGRDRIRFVEAATQLTELPGLQALVDLGPSGSQATLVRQAVALPATVVGHAILSPYASGDAELHNLRRVETALTMTTDASASVPLAAPAAPRVDEPAPAKRRAVVFAGQGAQIRGMGEALFARYQEQTAEADDILGYSIAALCRDDPDGRLRDTRYTQPALFVVNALAYRAHLESADPPDMLAGHSLGELNALVAGGAFDFATGLKIVKTRGALMGDAPAGAMSAVLGLGRDVITQVLAAQGLDAVDLANINTPSQLVISGDAAQVAAARDPLERAGAKAVIALPVGGAFHSRLMRPAEEAFAQAVASHRIGAPVIPVLSNVTGRPHGPDSVAFGMVRLVSRPVDWVGCVEHMLEAGVDTFTEIAPKPVLANMIAETRASWTPRPAKRDRPETPSTATVRVDEAEAATPPNPAPSDASRAAPLALAEDADKTAPAPAQPVAERVAISPAPAIRRGLGFAAETLGSAAFRTAHNTRYAHICGAMVHGIASVPWVVACARAGILSFFGSGGLSPERVEQAILDLQKQLDRDAPWGMNLLNGSNEAANVALFLKHGVRRIEASAYVRISKDLVRYRLSGLQRDGGAIHIVNRIVAKLSRPEVAIAFLSPPPAELVAELLREGGIGPEEAALAAHIPMADDITVEADSGGHTDQGVAAVLIPAICRLRDRIRSEQGYAASVRIGAGGGIGTPEAAASALMLGAEYLVTGSINQCTREAGTSDLVKQMLAEAEVQDTAYAPAGDMFEIGARVQVLRRGVFFPARANRLFELYMRHDCLEDIDARSRQQIEDKYFQRSFDSVWKECCDYWPPEAIAHAERVPKQKMAYVFRWYFGLSGRLALQGVAARKVDFQIHCGRSMGAFNQWIRGEPLEDWRARTVSAVTLRLLEGTAQKLETAITRLIPEPAHA